MSVKTSAMTDQQLAKLLRDHGAKRSSEEMVRRVNSIRADGDAGKTNLLHLTAWLAQEFMTRGAQRKAKNQPE